MNLISLVSKFSADPIPEIHRKFITTGIWYSHVFSHSTEKKIGVEKSDVDRRQQKRNLRNIQYENLLQ
jgi:hypothetical protein